MKVPLYKTAAVLLVAAGAMLPCSAGPLPSKQEAAALLQKAEEQQRINKPGSPPFHVVAKLQYTVGGQTLDGTYEILWAAPDRFREEFRLGALRESDVALGDNRYVLRNTPYLSYPLWRFRLLTRLERSGKQPAARKIARVRPGLRGGQGTVCLQVQPEEPPLPAHCFDPHTVCVETGSPLMGPTYCLDADNGQMVSMDLRPWREDPNPLEARDEYVSIGEGRYPKHIVSTSGADTLEVRVQKIELVRRFADDVFVPPAGSYQQDWCPSPEIKETKGTTVDAQSLLSNLIPLGPPRLHVFYYRVDAQGQIEGVAEFNSDGTLKVISQDRLGASRLAIHSCSGKPVAYEDISVLAARKNMLLSDGFWLGTWVALPQPRRP